MSKDIKFQAWLMCNHVAVGDTHNGEVVTVSDLAWKSWKQKQLRDAFEAARIRHEQIWAEPCPF